ncbi:hypothetical protein HOD75_04350 [archaeon]|jgi:hypothetical protein|nr:hypothetical protein [archaeon]MBT4242095.1 hypothetical protein [archaeon]MBT4417783.1 hypothetical protein [archaeon]
MKDYGRLERSVFEKALEDLKENGFMFLIVKTGRFFKHKFQKRFANSIVDKLKKKPVEFFYFDDKKFPYFLHPYNLTWDNERIVEIPILLEYLKKVSFDKVLEVGAVLPHYADVKWDVLDKFEPGEGILNQDIVDFKPKKRYDLIMSISTLEHVGYDDEYNPEKIVKAINHLKSLLSYKGKFIATMPLGYNKYMDSLVFSNKIGAKKMFFLKRVNSGNKWKEVGLESIRDIRYNSPHNNANGIVVCFFEK